MSPGLRLARVVIEGGRIEEMEDVADSDMRWWGGGGVLRPLSFHEPHHGKSLASIYDGDFKIWLLAKVSKVF